MQDNAMIKKNFERSTGFTNLSGRTLFVGSLLHVFLGTSENRIFLPKPLEFCIFQSCMS